MNNETPQAPIQPSAGTPQQPIAGSGTSQDPIVKPGTKQPMTAKQKRDAVIGGVVAVVLLILYIVYKVIAGNAAQKDVNYVVEQCEKGGGLYSQACKDAQSERHVNCYAKGLQAECTKNY